MNSREEKDALCIAPFLSDNGKLRQFIGMMAKKYGKPFFEIGMLHSSPLQVAELYVKLAFQVYASNLLKDTNSKIAERYDDIVKLNPDFFLMTQGFYKFYFHTLDDPVNSVGNALIKKVASFIIYNDIRYDFLFAQFAKNNRLSKKLIEVLTQHPILSNF